MSWPDRGRKTKGTRSRWSPVTKSAKWHSDENGIIINNLICDHDHIHPQLSPYEKSMKVSELYLQHHLTLNSFCCMAWLQCPPWTLGETLHIGNHTIITHLHGGQLGRFGYISRLAFSVATHTFEILSRWDCWLFKQNGPTMALKDWELPTSHPKSWMTHIPVGP